MALVAVGGKLLNRTYNAPRALLAAAFLLILLNPKVLVFDVGFHLSFLATAGIIYLFPVANFYLAKLSFLSKLARLRELIAVTISAQLAVSPYLLYAMGNVSLVAIVTNILIVPVVPFAMMFGFIGTLLSLVSSLAAMPLAYIAHILLSWILWVSGTFGNLSLASINFPSFPLWAAVVLYLAIIIFVWRWKNSPQPAAN